MNAPPPVPEQHASSRMVILGLLLLVAIPVLYYGLRGEPDRWRAAIVMERYLDGDKAIAIEQLQSLSDRLPDDHRLKMELGTWLLDDEQGERALELAQQIPEAFRDRRAQRLLQHALIANGKADEALQVYRDANPANISRTVRGTINHLNALAYYQALAGQELELALQNSNSVVKEWSSRWNQSRTVHLDAHLQTIFASAMLYRFRMVHEENNPEQARKHAENALAILSNAISQLESMYESICVAASRSEQARERRLRGSVFSGPPQQDDVDQQENNQSGDKKEWSPAQQRKEELAHTLGLFWTLRALIYQNLDKDKASWRDRRMVENLGLEPERIADWFPSLSECESHLSTMTMILDTRGCVHVKLGNDHEALRDLNAAVFGQQALIDVAEILPRTNVESSLDPRQQFEKFNRRPRKRLAVYLFHRSWALRAAGDKSRAISDTNAIRQLGYTPGRYLF